MERYTTVEEQVEYGLDKIDASRTIELNLRDFLYLHKTLGEFVRFFHQPMHYKSLHDVENFLGNVDSGAFHLLSECYYKKFEWGATFPSDVAEMLDGGALANPDYPYYYKP